MSKGSPCVYLAVDESSRFGAHRVGRRGVRYVAMWFAMSPCGSLRRRVVRYVAVWFATSLCGSLRRRGFAT